MYRFWYAIRILGAMLMLGVAGLLILTLFGVDVGLFPALNAWLALNLFALIFIPFRKELWR